MIGGFGDSFGDPEIQGHPQVNMPLAAHIAVATSAQDYNNRDRPSRYPETYTNPLPVLVGLRIKRIDEVLDSGANSTILYLSSPPSARMAR